jgi:HK97 family phage portal protein
MGLIDNLVTSVFGKPEEVRSGMPAALLPANRATQGSSVTAGEALTLPAVYRAISILTTTVKQMNIDVVRDDRVVGQPSLISQPNPLTSRSTFVEQTMVSLASQGNAYWRIDKDSAGKTIALVPLNPIDMQVETDTAGNIIRYQYQGVNYLPNRIKHLSLLGVPGSPIGLGPIQAASASIHGAIELRDYASTWFEKAGVPSGVLKTDQFVNDDQVKAAKEAWNATAGAKSGVAVLGNNWSYMPVYLKPDELQFLQNQAYTVTETARLFGIPATLMLTAIEGSSMTYANVEQEWLAFIRFTVIQYLIVIEDALSDFLTGRTRAKFNVEAILRGATKDRYEAHKLALDAGWMTVDEVRAIEDLPPLPEQEQPQPVVEPQAEPAVEGDPNV